MAEQYDAPQLRYGIDLSKYGIAPDDISYDEYARNAYGNPEIFESNVALGDLNTALDAGHITPVVWEKYTKAISKNITTLRNKYDRS